jgi:hypothetical protein
MRGRSCCYVNPPPVSGVMFTQPKAKAAVIIISRWVRDICRSLHAGQPPTFSSVPPSVMRREQGGSQLRGSQVERMGGNPPSQAGSPTCGESLGNLENGTAALSLNYFSSTVGAVTGVGLRTWTRLIMNEDDSGGTKTVGCFRSSRWLIQAASEESERH